LKGVQVAMLANGPGPKLAGIVLDIARDRLPIDALISTGFCGGLQWRLDPFDIFVATEVFEFGPASVPISSRPFKTGKLLSIDRVLSNPRKKSDFGALDAVEMEAAAVAARARAWRVPFYAVRVVTDTSYETFPLDFNHMRSPDGRFSRAKIIRAALRRPFAVFPELIKMNNRTKRAAQALGDFLADSRF
jgi:nucleoside phosphorylase